MHPVAPDGALGRSRRTSRSVKPSSWRDLIDDIKFVNPKDVKDGKAAGHEAGGAAFWQHLATAVV
ncbi:MAG: hypothetical protein IH804_05855 [Planctomycetes bacterium]|nr:hypothetical protein [Planctomycetota bacterium]